MKTLSQIEARTPVDASNTPGTSSAQFAITQPGSYYLTANITGVGGVPYGILIEANDVTLDLNGFAMTGLGNGYYGIVVSVIGANQNIVVRNGTLRNWGEGVAAPNGYCELEQLRVFGSALSGFSLGDHCAVRNCSALNNGNTGILVGSFSQVADCLVSSNASGGIVSSNTCSLKNCTVSGNAATGMTIGNGCVVADSVVSFNATGISGGSDCSLSGSQASYNLDDGIDLNNNFNLSQCTANGNGRSGSGYGFKLGNGGTVNNCTASTNESGFAVWNSCTVNNCTASSNGDGGILTTGNDCAVNDCTASDNTSYGILVGGNNCTVINCTACGNTNDYEPAGIEVNGNNCQITGNNCGGNGYAGILIFGTQNRIDYNTAGNNASYGIQVDTLNVTNSITRNSAIGNGYLGYAGDSAYAPTQTPNTATSPWANF